MIMSPPGVFDTFDKSSKCGTAFLASVKKDGRRVPAVFSAGHNFKENGILPENFSLADFQLEFDTCPPLALALDVLSSCLPSTTLVLYKAEMVVLESGVVVHRSRESPCDMDWFVMILQDRVGEPESALKMVQTELGLEPLECGEGSYLEPAPGYPVIVFGYPGVGTELSNPKLRWSMGVELDKCYPGKNCQTCEMSSKLTALNNPQNHCQRIFYDNDTCPGNSGSPVLSRGGSNTGDMAYTVKGIHVDGYSEPGGAPEHRRGHNGAQSLIQIMPTVISFIM